MIHSRLPTPTYWLSLPSFLLYLAPIDRADFFALSCMISAYRLPPLPLCVIALVQPRRPSFNVCVPFGGATANRTFPVILPA